MKCKCGNIIDVAIGAKIKSEGCSVLSSVTCVATIKCLECGSVFQVPISSKQAVIKDY